MAREFIAIPNQIVAPGADILFEGESRNYIYHEAGRSLFRLASPRIIGYSGRGCCCNGMPIADYLVAFHGNVQIPEGGTVDEISVSLITDGAVDPSGQMLTTPTAVEIPDNIGASIIDYVPWICGCSSVSVRNTGAEPIEIVSGNIILNFTGVRR